MRRRIFLPSLLLLAGSVTTTHAFVVQKKASSSSPRVAVTGEVVISALGRLSSTSTNDHNTTTEGMRHDIEVLRQQAQERLSKLNEQMEELKQQKKDLKEFELQQVKEERAATTTTPTATTTTTPLSSSSSTATTAATTDERQAPSSAPLTTTAPLETHQQQQPHRLDLLDETRWKIVFNLGREAGTWMPPSWGASGARLLFEVVIDFTSTLQYDERDEFFQGVAGCKQLKVVDAWMFPVMANGQKSSTVGRRKIKVHPTGTFKVLPGQGPGGTDIVRLCLEVQEESVCHDDVSCPVGRIYGTCGYFPIQPKQNTAWKDQLAQDHHAVAIQYEQLKAEDEQDSRIWNMLARMKELFQVRRKLEKLAAELQHARQIQPDKSDLRLSRDGKVGLSREGGVCRKVQKGIAIEYHILGRMEVASINKDDEQHDQYEELVHEFHP